MQALKVVLHIDEIEKWPLNIGNAKNFITDIGQEAFSMEIIANGPAVKIFSSPSPEQQLLLEELQLLAEKGVKLMVCSNALRANQIVAAELPRFTTIVPAGITRLVVLQQAGYSYVKP